MNINSRIKQLLQISLVAIVLMSSGISVMAQTFDADNIAFGGINMPYRVAHTSGMGKPSLVIYLHGGTSKGNDNEKQMGEPGIDSIANYIKQQQMGVYFLVPQCPSDKSWGGPMLSVLKALIDQYIMEGVVDKTMYIYLEDLWAEQAHGVCCRHIRACLQQLCLWLVIRQSVMQTKWH